MNDDVISLSEVRASMEAKSAVRRKDAFLLLFTTMMRLPPDEVRRINRKYGGTNA